MLRKQLWRLGFRYRLHGSSLPGKPDIVLPRRRAVVFVDGDFWHVRGWPKRKDEASTRRECGLLGCQDRERNRTRDRANTGKLRRAGGVVIRVWESDIRANSALVAQRIEWRLAFLTPRRSP